MCRFLAATREARNLHDWKTIFRLLEHDNGGDGNGILFPNEPEPRIQKTATEELEPIAQMANQQHGGFIFFTRRTSRGSDSRDNTQPIETTRLWFTHNGTIDFPAQHILNRKYGLPDDASDTRLIAAMLDETPEEEIPQTLEYLIRSAGWAYRNLFAYIKKKKPHRINIMTNKSLTAFHRKDQPDLLWDIVATECPSYVGEPEGTWHRIDTRGGSEPLRVTLDLETAQIFIHNEKHEICETHVRLRDRDLENSPTARQLRHLRKHRQKRGSEKCETCNAIRNKLEKSMGLKQYPAWESHFHF